MPLDTTTIKFQIDNYGQYLYHHHQHRKAKDAHPTTRIPLSTTPLDLGHLLKQACFGLTCITNWSWLTVNPQAAAQWKQVAGAIDKLNQDDEAAATRTGDNAETSPPAQYPALTLAVPHSTHITVITAHKFMTSRTTKALLDERQQTLDQRLTDTLLHKLPFEVSQQAVEDRKELTLQWCARLHSYLQPQSTASTPPPTPDQLPVTYNVPIQPFTVTIDSILLLNNAVIGLASAGSEQLTAMRQQLKQRITEQSPDLLDEIILPGIVHTTLARVTRIPNQPQQFRDHFNTHIAPMWKPVELIIDHLDLVIDVDPYMHHTEQTAAIAARYELVG